MTRQEGVDTRASTESTRVGVHHPREEARGSEHDDKYGRQERKLHVLESTVYMRRQEGVDTRASTETTRVGVHRLREEARKSKHDDKNGRQERKLHVLESAIHERRQRRVNMISEYGNYTCWSPPSI